MTDDVVEKLIAAAQAAMQNAYAPYSDYGVGAALLDDRGRIFTGCNVENASYGLSMCAERSAVFQALAHGSRKFAAIAVASGGEPPAYPCGACRQVLAEFCGRDLQVYIAGRASNEVVCYALGELLPHAFGGAACED